MVIRTGQRFLPMPSAFTLIQCWDSVMVYIEYVDSKVYFVSHGIRFYSLADAMRFDSEDDD